MLVAMPGSSILRKEISEMLTNVGFRDVAVKPSFGYWSIVTGCKP